MSQFAKMASSSNLEVVVFLLSSLVRAWLLTYVAYVHTSTFVGIHMILDIRTLTPTLIFPSEFESFQNFCGSYNFILFKNILRCIWTLTYLLVFGRDRFFTVYICFKETPYFSIFHTNYLINISPNLRALISLQCQ